MLTALHVARGRCCGSRRAGRGALASVGAPRGRGSGHGLGGQPTPRWGGVRGAGSPGRRAAQLLGGLRRGDGAGCGGRAPLGGHSADPLQRGLAPDAGALPAEAPRHGYSGGELEAFSDCGSRRPCGARTAIPPLLKCLQPPKWFPETPERGGCGRDPSSRLAPAPRKRTTLTAGCRKPGTHAPLSCRDPASPRAG